MTQLPIITGQLDVWVEGIKEEAFAGNTNRVRRSQWKQYRLFTERWGLEYLPINALNLCRFMVDCATRGLCYTTINNYVSGINLLSKLNGGGDLREDFGVGLTLQGLRRILGSVVKPKDPLMPADLVQIFHHVNLDNHREKSIWIGVLICFRTLVRKCHLFPTSQSNEHLLCRDNISFTEWGFQLTVPTSKTNQFKQRTFMSPVTKSDSELCIVRQLKVYWSKFKRSEGYWPIVCEQDGKPIYYESALKVLKKWCNLARLNKDVGFHSLRRGAATHMSVLGIPLHDIKSEGDWQSMSVLLYLASPLEHRLSTDLKISESLSKF